MRKHWSSGGLAFGALVVLAITAVTVQPIPPEPRRAASLGRPECPGERDTLRIVVESGGVSHVISHITLSGRIANIPEFHDCQQFIKLGDTTRFDSLYAIFAAFELKTRLLWGNFKRAVDSVTLPTGGRVSAVPVVTVFSRATTPYAPLGISPGFNCLFVYPNPSIPGEWQAKMVPWGFADSNCTSHQQNLTSGMTLEVRRSPAIPAYEYEDYPAVARWDWDPVNKQQYIGLACGTRWCEIGKPHFRSSTPYAGPFPTFHPVPGIAVTTAMQGRVTKIKGWNDAQKLARWDAALGMLVPSKVRGTIIPNPALDHMGTLAEALPTYAKWVNVGAAVIRGADYKAMKPGVNLIFLCYGSPLPPPAGCGVPLPGPATPTPPSSVTLTACAAAAAASLDGKGWWARIEHQPAEGYQPLYSCWMHTDHTGDLATMFGSSTGFVAEIPGAARWRWLLRDEAIWFGCTTASCCSEQ